jgi:photosystem II stability/assembly factor-like uncharacterized protein
VSRDSGASFERIRGIEGLLKQIFVAGDRVLVAGNDGLFLSTDGGRSVRNLAKKLDYADAYAVTEHDGVTYVTTSKGLAISRDSGASFAVHALPERHIAASQVLIDQHRQNRVYLATERGLAVSTDGGKSFSLTSPCADDAPLCKDVDKWQQSSIKAIAVHGNDLYAIGADSMLFRSTDNGRSLTPVVDSTGAPRKGITALAVHGDRLWLGTRDGVLVSSDHGKTVEPPAHLDAIRVEIRDIAFAGDTAYLATPAGLYQAMHVIDTTPP